MTGKLIVVAGCGRRAVLLFVGSVHAVGISVTDPLPRNALRSVPVLVLGASELHFIIAFAIV